MVKPVTEEPEVTLELWGVVLDRSGYRLVGQHADSRRGRISSPIVAADPSGMVGETESGRIYRLVGPEDRETATLVAYGHAMKWGLEPDELAMATWDEAVLALVPGLSAGWH